MPDPARAFTQLTRTGRSRGAVADFGNAARRNRCRAEVLIWLRGLDAALRSTFRIPSNSIRTGGRLSADRFAGGGIGLRTVGRSRGRARSSETMVPLRGTEGSNPLPSSGESRANLKTTSTFRCRLARPSDERGGEHCCSGQKLNRRNSTYRTGLMPRNSAQQERRVRSVTPISLHNSVVRRLGSSVARCRVGPATEYDRRLRPCLIGVAIPRPEPLRRLSGSIPSARL
jgi:hypothetical protein